MKRLLRRILEALVGDEKSREAERRAERLRAYHEGGNIPWSCGYEEAHADFIESVLADDDLMQRFREGTQLPEHFGTGIDERCIELPWLFAGLRPEHRRLLDAGSSLNYEHLLRRLTMPERTLHVFTLAPEPVCFYQMGISYIFGDMRDAPLRSDYYDCVMCISTL
ncbi:MAG: hypothetical protein ACYSU0_06250, partial [Planctomycetota bacterium]